jgi:hypothetical protein
MDTSNSRDARKAGMPFTAESRDVTTGGTTAAVVTLARAGTQTIAGTPARARTPSTIYMYYRGA